MLRWRDAGRGGGGIEAWREHRAASHTLRLLGSPARGRQPAAVLPPAGHAARPALPLSAHPPPAGDRRVEGPHQPAQYCSSPAAHCSQLPQLLTMQPMPAWSPGCTRQRARGNERCGSVGGRGARVLPRQASLARPASCAAPLTPTNITANAEMLPTS